MPREKLRIPLKPKTHGVRAIGNRQSIVREQAHDNLARIVDPDLEEADFLAPDVFWVVFVGFAGSVVEEESEACCTDAGVPVAGNGKPGVRRSGEVSDNGGGLGFRWVMGDTGTFRGVAVEVVAGGIDPFGVCSVGGELVVGE